MWGAAPHLRIPWQQLPNGGAVAPQFGDLVVFGRAPTSPAGHVAVVAATGPDHVDIVEQNWGLSNPTGRARLSINGTTTSDRRGMPALGWLRGSPLPDGPGGDAARGIALRADGVRGYVLDGSGGVHPFGGAPPLLVTAYWPGLDVARGIALRPDGRSAWIVDRWNGVHSVGSPSLIAPR